MFEQIGQSCCPILVPAFAGRFNALSTLITFRIRLDAQGRHKDRDDRDRSENSARGQTCHQSAYLTGVTGISRQTPARSGRTGSAPDQTPSNQRSQSGRD